MEETHIRRLVVVDDDGVACGLLTHHEIARGLEGDYVTYLREIVELQARDLQHAAQAIDEKLLLANILRSVTGTAVLASDLEYRDFLRNALGRRGAGHAPGGDRRDRHPRNPEKGRLGSGRAWHSIVAAVVQRAAALHGDDRPRHDRPAALGPARRAGTGAGLSCARRRGLRGKARWILSSRPLGLARSARTRRVGGQAHVCQPGQCPGIDLRRDGAHQGQRRAPQRAGRRSHGAALPVGLVRPMEGRPGRRAAAHHGAGWRPTRATIPWDRSQQPRAAPAGRSLVDGHRAVRRDPRRHGSSGSTCCAANWSTAGSFPRRRVWRRLSTPMRHPGAAQQADPDAFQRVLVCAAEGMASFDLVHWLGRHHNEEVVHRRFAGAYDLDVGTDYVDFAEEARVLRLIAMARHGLALPLTRAFLPDYSHVVLLLSGNAERDLSLVQRVGQACSGVPRPRRCLAWPGRPRPTTEMFALARRSGSDLPGRRMQRRQRSEVGGRRSRRCWPTGAMPSIAAGRWCRFGRVLRHVRASGREGSAIALRSSGDLLELGPGASEAHFELVHQRGHRLASRPGGDAAPCGGRHRPRRWRPGWRWFRPACARGAPIQRHPAC